MSISAKPPSGMRDFLPADVARREWVVSKIRDVYRRHGFLPLETPTMERLDVLTGKYGEEGQQLIFRVLKRRDNLPDLATVKNGPDELCDMALRYDLTVPLARVVAAYSSQLPKFFKRYQIQPVWRADRPQKGRFREFYQCDVDFVGTTSVVAEATVVQAVTEALLALGFDRFTVRMNDRRVLSGLMEASGIAKELHGTTLVAIDKLDKIGVDGVRAELVERGLSELSADTVLELVALGDAGLNDGELLATLAERFQGVSETGVAGIDTLRQLLELLEPESGAPRPWKIDPSLARGLSYYTGPIFEIAVEGLSGSMGGGGRYDELVGMFRGQTIPAVGFSLGLERILVVMEDRGMFPELGMAPDLVVVVPEASAQVAALKFASQCRAAGLRTEVYPEPAKIGKQIQYAESLGASRVAILGSREARDGMVGIKDLVSGEQVVETWAQAIASLTVKTASVEA